MIRRTSIEAYNKIKEDGLLTEARFSVYDILYAHGPLTGGEVFMWMRRKNEGHTVVKGSVCARLTELREVGVVDEIGKRECELTGHTAILWDVTEHLPVVPAKRRTKDEIISELKRENAALHEENHRLKKNLSGELF